MTWFDLAVDGDPPADVGASAVLGALVRSGRFVDAAAYYPAVDDPRPVVHAQLLLAAGRTDEAHAALADAQPTEDDDPRWLAFLRRVDAVLQGSAYEFPDLVSASAAFAGNAFTPLLMLRAAAAAGRGEAAGHYANAVLGIFPGDSQAAQAAAADLLQRGRYADAVNLLDTAERLRCPDEPSPLSAVLANVTATEAFALTLIGRFMHREKDPTKPVTEAVREARQRWRAAYRPFAPRLRRPRLAWAALTATSTAVAIAIGNVLPSLVVIVAYGAWTRSHALPGLDLRTSRLVRAICDPLLIVKARRYRPIDVYTFVFTLVVAGGGATQLPRGPSWFAWVEVLAVVGVAVAATRGRRRWVRREQQRLVTPPFDPQRCCCLDVPSLQGPQARPYVEEHLFRIGAVRGAPARWDVLQCLATHTRFLDLPDGLLTLRLS